MVGGRWGAGGGWVGARRGSDGGPGPVSWGGLRGAGRPLIHRMGRGPLWCEAEAAGRFTGAQIDREDGSIHFSTAERVAEAEARHFAGQDDLLLVAVEADALGGDLRYEPSRGGDLFPHLYGPLPLSAVVAVDEMPLGADGRHAFPAGILPA